MQRQARTPGWYIKSADVADSTACCSSNLHYDSCLCSCVAGYSLVADAVLQQQRNRRQQAQPKPVRQARQKRSSRTVTFTQLCLCWHQGMCSVMWQQTPLHSSLQELQYLLSRQPRVGPQPSCFQDVWVGDLPHRLIRLLPSCCHGLLLLIILCLNQHLISCGSGWHKWWHISQWGRISQMPGASISAVSICIV